MNFVLSNAYRLVKELALLSKISSFDMDEIEAGIQQVSQPDLYRFNLQSLLRQVRIWPVDRSTSRIYGELHHDLKRSGRVLSQVDMMIAALAQQMNLTIATTDGDFSALSKLPTENWLK